MTRRTRLTMLALSIAAVLLPAAGAHGTAGEVKGEEVDPAIATLARIASRLPRSRVNRPADLVIVPGTNIPALGREAPLARLRLMAFDLEDDWVVIPFQIDERDADGRWVVKNPPARESPQGDGVLSPKDELVFRARDLGPRAARTAWPEGARHGAEIEVRDPLGRGRGWAYLFRFEDPPPLADGVSIRTYAGSAARGDSVLTPFYKVYYPRDGVGRYRPGVMTELAIDGRGGEKYGPDLLDRGKLRYSAPLRLLPFRTFRRTEQQITARPRGVTDGPIRALRPVARRFHLTGRPDIEVTGMTTFLPDHIIINGPDWIPARLGFFSRRADVRYAWDFNAPSGSTVHTASVPAGVPADGVMGPDEAALDDAPSAWWALDTPAGGALLAIYEHRRRDGRVTVLRNYPTLFYRDDGAPEPPENSPGSAPAIGWRLRGRARGSHPEHAARIHLFVLEKFRPGDERSVLRRMRAPLRVSAGEGLAR